MIGVPAKMHRRFVVSQVEICFHIDFLFLVRKDLCNLCVYDNMQRGKETLKQYRHACVHFQSGQETDPRLRSILGIFLELLLLQDNHPK